MQALCDDGTEIFVKKAAPTPLNEELCATIQTEFIIPVLHRDEITLQFQVRFRTGMNIISLYIAHNYLQFADKAQGFYRHINVNRRMLKGVQVCRLVSIECRRLPITVSRRACDVEYVNILEIGRFSLKRSVPLHGETIEI